MTAATQTYKIRTMLWRALCQCLFEHRQVTLLPRPYNGRPDAPGDHLRKTRMLQ